MSKGAKAVLVCPPDWAYGERGWPKFRIMENETLIFIIELLGFRFKEGHVPRRRKKKKKKKTESCETK